MSELSSKQLQLISNLLSSPTIEKACGKTGIDRGSYYIWLKNADFKAELKNQRDEVVKEALDRLKMAMTKATEGLIKLLDAKKPDLKRWVCKDIIDYTLKSIEFEDIEERLDRVEKALLEKRTYK